MRADLVAFGVRLRWVGVDDKEETAFNTVMATRKAIAARSAGARSASLDAAKSISDLPAAT
jgi:hypothetical protein